MTARFARVTLMLGSALLLASCATMTPDECKHANWYDIGLRDGSTGEPLSILDDRRRDCAEAKVTVDSRPYLAGRENGLKSYCRLENASRYGLEGKTYHGVCPSPLHDEFSARFELGKAVHDLRAELATLEDRIDSQERRRRNLDQDEAKALKDVSKDEERRRIRKEYDSRRDDVRDELRDLDRKLARVRQHLRDAEARLGMLR